ncbi:GNAT family N-acetyltransferase [Paraburkholderia sp. D15]|uniref:GNAT family N-acetyltransferase n=1 Tax=Paraburkholderia sp. D15 TaxID=2880218 RepID=UPI00247B144F|nr:GNAT family N-acetyltransferase [Paraburkholderia sp. D15]WGS54759.1 GNAT family N-acetyltransferase [Paraburkholderia sp. D15]
MNQAEPSNRTNLDNPIWAALTTTQAHLGQGDALARRYFSDVAPFAALAGNTPDAYRSLHQLLQPGEQVGLLSAERVTPIDELRAIHVGALHQMVATRSGAGETSGQDVIRLTEADVDDMLALVQQTKPGPFARRTREMGHYIGIRDNGRLIAMAGERMHVDGYVEISAVCVDDAWRGKGLAGRLMTILRNEIERRGETPFLHVLGENISAIGLYERLGFTLRRTFVLSRIALNTADEQSTVTRT